MELQVDCGPGPDGEPEPQELRLGATRIGVVEILDRWPAPGYRYFKVRGDEDGVYIVRHEPGTDAWRLVFYRAADAARSPDTPGTTEGRS